ncbi:MAG: YitT family protein, partial [Bacteroidetes bacterium]|nr:YitT family protein [Bacteroidota bacterium]
MSKKIFSAIQMYTLMIIGLALYVFGVTAFLIPLKITAGGVTGISMLIFYATGIPAGYPYFAINSFLFIK